MRKSSLTIGPHARAIASACVVALGCAPGSAPRPAHTAAKSDAAIDPMQGAPKGALPWAEFSAATFARARAERRFVVLDAAAEWCHWCHVMEATTYHDPRVQKVLGERFIQVKVDVDSRPDLEERYGDYGWPATVIFSPDAEELGKYRSSGPHIKAGDDASLALISMLVNCLPITRGRLLDGTRRGAHPFFGSVVW